MKSYFNIFRMAIFAGVLIAVAGYGFLAGKTVGMFLFILGLAAVVSYQLKLYTGTVGFVKWRELPSLLVVLVGNILGCMLVALIAKVDTVVGVQAAAVGVLKSRLALGWWACGVKAIGCGILMSVAVHFARKGKEFGYWRSDSYAPGSSTSNYYNTNRSGSRYTVYNQNPYTDKLELSSGTAFPIGMTIEIWGVRYDA